MADHLTLCELQSLIKAGIDRSHPLPYWVTAEISECKVNYSGHCYLEMVEKGGKNHVPQAKLSAVMWRSTYQMVEPYFRITTGQEICSGLQVLVKGIVIYHELYGLSFQILDIDPNYTLGDMERQRQETILQLQEDGVYEMNRELELPIVVQRLAIVSSRNAAGYQDFMNELSDGPYHFETRLYDAFMQGAQTEDSVIEALGAIMDEADRYDAVVLIRGGGSTSDLGAFDSYRLCCHLAQFPLPVIAGIGHDKDQSVADLVAHTSLKTPTAVAVFLKEEMSAFEGQLELWQEELVAGLSGKLHEETDRIQRHAFNLKLQTAGMVQALEHSLSHYGARLGNFSENLLKESMGELRSLSSRFGHAAEFLVAGEISKLGHLQFRLQQQAREMIDRKNRELLYMEELVKTQDPQHILKRGFAFVHQDSRLISDAGQLAPGDDLKITFYSGEAVAEVKEIKRAKTARSSKVNK